MPPRVVFELMEPGVDRIGLRQIRREFGVYGDIFCASLRLDRFGQPASVEVEFIEASTALKVKDWNGTGSDLALYKADGLIDAKNRDLDAPFLCHVDNFGQGQTAICNSFADLKTFASFLTDTCCVTTRASALCWAPGRGVYAQVYCEQKADQERLISWLDKESYMSRKLSCSSMANFEYSGVNDGGYRVDWATVGSTIQALSDRLRQHSEVKDKKKTKDAKKDKKTAKKDKKDKKDKKKEKNNKEAKGDKKGKEQAKKDKEKAKKRESDSSSSSDEKPPAAKAHKTVELPKAKEPVPKTDAAAAPSSSEYEYYSGDSSAESAQPKKEAAPPRKMGQKHVGPMAALADDDSSS
eukprot:TRINITY_DN4273_c0_g1_i1.p1 TRINITY_DN4273_c0_g1~~TRINITY_DN4273_c0_g1_i1.p1  ORF type:complete len:353 (+),score=70.85 TRINITY_DN4273_c0_g1_i1:260-1318(+)